jgi:hypothetical protein
MHFLRSAAENIQDIQTLANFRLELLDAGIPSSFGRDILSQTKSGYWITVEKNRLADLPNRPLDIVNLEAEVAILPNIGPASPAYGVSITLSEKINPGLNDDNALGVRAVALREMADVSRMSMTVAAGSDCVIAISDKILRNGRQRKLIKQAVSEIANDGFSKVKILPEYIRDIVPYGPYITHFRRTQSQQHRAVTKSEDRQTLDRERLMEDARVAWTYFGRWTNTKTGLCPATVNFSEGGVRLHEAVTMWDVGSQINALIAAVDLELITPAKFRRSIRAIIPNIAGRRSQGRLLPQGWIATDKFKWGNKNFDGCDAGRLLAALYNLDTHPHAKEMAAQTVSAWDLRDTVKDGIVYSVEEGKLASTFRSHCAHYAAWAFRTWGIEVRSPYEVFQGKSTSDGQMALLEVCGDIGPMGAEPLLLEALELGMSQESAYLAEVLFAAQLEEYEHSGKLTCVSEGPIDRSPWFTYQGLQFDAPGRVWATDTVEGLAEHRSEAFRAKNLVISSKAAYLWAAYKDHPYCETLVRFVRERAITKSGFASSIYQNTGEPTATYADINTNAIILQSIAHKLKYSKDTEQLRDG